MRIYCNIIVRIAQNKLKNITTCNILWETCGTRWRFLFVSADQHINHMLFSLSPSVSVCVWVCVWETRLAQELTVYHVTLQETRCPCTGHPHRKSIRKNGDYIWGDWPLVIPFFSLSLWNSLELPSFIFIFHLVLLHPPDIWVHVVEAALHIKVCSDLRMLGCQSLTAKCCFKNCDDNPYHTCAAPEANSFALRDDETGPVRSGPMGKRVITTAMW